MNINASLFVQLVVFLLGAWITMKYIWPPLIHAIEERQKKIADGLSAANKGEKALAIATEQGKAETLRRRSIRSSRNTVRTQANKGYTALLTGRNN